WVPGGALGATDCAFHGNVLPHPIRNYALTVNLNEVIAKVNAIKGGDIPELNPLGVLTVLNSFQDNITANAAPPSFLGLPYAIAKMDRADLDNGYIATHEMAHASLNFLDEYVENGLENMNIRSLDIGTPLILLDGSWSGFIRAISDLLGIYDYNVSEIL